MDVNNFPTGEVPHLRSMIHWRHTGEPPEEFALHGLWRDFMGYSYWFYGGFSWDLWRFIGYSNFFMLVFHGIFWWFNGIKSSPQRRVWPWERSLKRRNPGLPAQTHSWQGQTPNFGRKHAIVMRLTSNVCWTMRVYKWFIFHLLHITVVCSWVYMWQCVKTNSTPSVHIKIAGIYGWSFP